MDRKKIKINFDKIIEGDEIRMEGSVCIFSTYYINPEEPNIYKLDIEELARKNIERRINNIMYEEFNNSINELQSIVYRSLGNTGIYSFRDIKDKFDKVRNSLPEFVTDE